MDTLDTTWLHLRSSTTTAPYQLFTTKSDEIVWFAVKGKATVDAATGNFTSGAKTNHLTLVSVSGEDDTWLRSESILNDVSDLTVDTTSTSERFSTTTILHNATGNNSLRVSQALVLQTADFSYTKIPQA